MKSISYILSPDEVKEALYTAKVLKPYKKKVFYIALVSLIIIILSFIPMKGLSFTQIIKNPNSYMPSIALVIANLFCYYGYKNNEKNRVRSATTGENTVLNIYDEYINVVVEAYDANWNIIKDDTFAVLESENLLIIQLTDGRLMPIPKRVLNDEEVKACLKTVVDYFCD